MRLRTLFSKPQKHSKLGVCLRQDSLAFCSVVDDRETSCQQLVALDKAYFPAIKSLADELSLDGACNIVLSSHQNQVVQVDKPNVPEEEIGEALKWQVKDLVSLDPNDMVVDYFDGLKLAGGAEKINVVCAKKSELASLVEKLTDEGFEPEVITTEEFAFASLVPVQDDACLLVCMQPDEELILIIVKQGKIFFHRRLRGFTNLAQKTEDELIAINDALSLEIQRSSDYFERQLKQAPIRTIEILVPIEKEAFLARKLAEITHIAVNIFSMPEGFEMYRQYAASVGATMLTNMEDKK